MAKQIRLDFGTLTLNDKFIIAVMDEGVHIVPEMNKVLVDIANTHYKNKTFVYLTHRVNSYSVDPAIYFQTSKIKNLVGFAVISDVPFALSNAQVEKLFLNKPFETFRYLDDAKQWATKIVDE